MSEAGPAVVEARNVSKRYYTVQALDDVSLDVWAGEVHAVVGENGAGKSTLMKILGGEERADHGAILVAGVPVSLAGPLQARRQGIAVVHQHIELVPAMTVAENIGLQDIPLRIRAGPFSVVDRRRLRRAARELLERHRIPLDPDAPVASLSVAGRQLLEIARALALRSKLVIMDEPTSSLEQHEVQKLFAHIRALTRGGTAVIFITHRLDEVLAIADRVTVLRDGRRVATCPTSTVDAPALVRLIVGRTLGEGGWRERQPAGEPFVRVTVGAAAPVGAFALRRREIYGVAGLLGSGVSELFKAVAGDAPRSAATVDVEGRRLAPAGVGARIRDGICFVPGDRHLEGLALEMSVEDNLVLPNLGALAARGLIDRGACRRVVLELIDTLDIRPPDPTLPVKYLSGGNQQKVVIGKWLISRARLLVMDDPTKGVDVGAKGEIHRIMSEFVAAARAILFTSSELPEVVGMSDRVLVMRNGAPTEELADAQVTPERVMASATGAR